MVCLVFWSQLLHFTSSAVVTRKELVGGVKVPPDELLDILRGLARRLPGTGWEFKCKQDTQFLLGHLEVVAKQLEWWRGRQERYQAGEGIESVVVCVGGGGGGEEGGGGKVCGGCCSPAALLRQWQR